MTISGQHKSKSNPSNDNGDYKAVIHRDALFLIVTGHSRMIADGVDYSDTDEEDITGILTTCIDEYINCLSSPDWTKHFYVHEELRENTNGKKGKRRKRVDIVCVLTGRKPQKRMKFEAKRLKRTVLTAGRYLGKEGLGEFIAGNYAKTDDDAGMLGYIQSDSCDHWADKISNALNNGNDVHLTDEGPWQKACLENIDNCYTTRHNRPTVGRKLLVYHLLLDFVKQ
ncbi:MAG: hypothetical protein P9M03_12655 [Candidatus Theseobacter exili]|nr:hypothetical protein [Candidatus Theseobacter exili]